MQISPVAKPRNVIPRWRTFDATRRSGELVPEAVHSVIQIQDDEDWREAAERWQFSQTVPTAIDMISAAIVLGREDETEAQEAASLVLRSPTRDLPGIEAVAGAILEYTTKRSRIDTTLPFSIREEEQSHNLRIHELRKRLHAEPRNAILWVELAREYTILGVNHKAVSAMENALRLADDNRFVVRSAARLFVHLDEPDRAHDLLRRTHSVGFDPWILASEIAVASVAGYQSQLMKKGRRLLAEETWNPFSTNELASALATFELTEGGLRDARKLFRTSLRDPNDNSLAQAEWASERLGGFSVADKQLEIPWSFEARARAKYRKADFLGAIQDCHEWHLDEPFSSRPLGIAGFIHSVAFGDFDKAAESARNGLKANPGDQLLRNNLAFALASADRLEEAKEEFAKTSKVDADASTSATLKATEGLINYREGRPGVGRSLYVAAIQEGADLTEEFTLLAKAYLAREELRAGTGDGVKRLAEFEDAISSLTHPDRVPYVNRLLSQVRAYLPPS